MISWSSWWLVAADFAILWAAVTIGYAWQLYWAERDHDRSHGHR